MSFAVLHVAKQKGDGGGLSAHIDRVKLGEDGHLHPWQPASVSRPERSPLNRDYILAEGETRSMAIARRIEGAGIKRAIRDDQVKAFSVILTSDHDKMAEIEAKGLLDQWAADSIATIRRIYGEKNVVAAALHMDEKTPHLHVTVVPITEVATRQRNKRVPDGDEPQKKRRYKKQGGARLCAADLLTPSKLEAAQSEYARVMAKYGMERGVVGSKAVHQAPAEYNLQKVKAETAAAEKRNAKLDDDYRWLLEDNDQAEERAAQLQKSVNALQGESTELTKGIEAKKRDIERLDVTHAVKEKVMGWLGQSEKDATIKAQEAKISRLTARITSDWQLITQAKKNAADAKREAENAIQQERRKAESQLREAENRLGKEKAAHQEELAKRDSALKEERQKAASAISNRESVIEQLKNSLTYLASLIGQMAPMFAKAVDAIASFLKDGDRSLTTDQAQSVRDYLSKWSEKTDREEAGKVAVTTANKMILPAPSEDRIERANKQVKAIADGTWAEERQEREERHRHGGWRR